MFENPNLIPKTLRRQQSQEISAISQPLSRSKSCPVRSAYLMDELSANYLENPSFETFSKSGLNHTVQNPIFLEKLQLEVVTPHLDQHL